MWSVVPPSATVPVLDTLPTELDRLVAATVQPLTAATWADIRAAGQRKIAALQHASSWASELQQTIVHMPTSDPLSHGQPPSLADFEMVREIQRGSHATVWLGRKRQTKDVFAMKVIDKREVAARKQIDNVNAERRILARLRHPFIVTLHFAFSTHGSGLS